MKIVPSRSLYAPAWVYADELEKVWRNYPSNVIELWEGPARNLWFEFGKDGEKKIAFCTADAMLKEENGKITIGFINGRHRTRWLLGLGNPLVPIGLNEKDYQIALDIGLAERRVTEEDQLL